MPSPKPSDRDNGRFPEKSLSFYGGESAKASGPRQLRRPKTLADLSLAPLIGSGGEMSPPVSPSPEGRPKLTKLLLSVTIQGSLGAVQLLMKPESTVSDLIAAAVGQYVKEGRRPVLPNSDPSGFDLHYSQFSLESLNREEKLMVLGSRNFFLCKRKTVETATERGVSGLPVNTATTTRATPSSSCSKQAEKAARTGFGLPWLKFKGFLQ